MAFPSIFSTYFDVSLLEIGTSSIFLVLFNLKVAMASTLVIRDLLRTLLKQNTALLFTFRLCGCWLAWHFIFLQCIQAYMPYESSEDPLHPLDNKKQFMFAMFACHWLDSIHNFFLYMWLEVHGNLPVMTLTLFVVMMSIIIPRRKRGSFCGRRIYVQQIRNCTALNQAMYPCIHSWWQGRCWSWFTFSHTWH